MLEPKEEEFVSIVFQSMYEQADERGYLSSAYKIGSAILAHKSYSESIKYKMTPSQVQNLWVALESHRGSELAIDPNQSRIEACRHWILADIELLEHIGEAELISLGQKNEQYTRIAFIALIRAHANNRAVFANFNYDTLKAGSIEQTCELISPTLSLCQSLPLQALKKLGAKNSKIARNILLDLKNHPQAQELLEFFETAHDWPKSECENIPIQESAIEPETVLESIQRGIDRIISSLKKGLFYLSQLPIIRNIRAPSPAPILNLYQLFCNKSACGYPSCSKKKPSSRA